MEGKDFRAQISTKRGEDIFVLKGDDLESLFSEFEEAKERYGFNVENTPTGEMRSIEPYRLVGASFEFVSNGGSVDTTYWTPTVGATPQARRAPPKAQPLPPSADPLIDEQDNVEIVKPEPALRGSLADSIAKNATITQAVPPVKNAQGPKRI